jgi:hypothetical protein
MKKKIVMFAGACLLLAGVGMAIKAAQSNKLDPNSLLMQNIEAIAGTEPGGCPCTGPKIPGYIGGCLSFNDKPCCDWYGCDNGI